MKTLYVSDLDGTLLRSDATLSEFSCRTINRLAAQGMLFSYATARSFETASKVTRGLTAGIPVIVNNGCFTIDNAAGSVILGNFFGPEVHGLIRDLLDHGICPMVYARFGSVEKFTYLEHRRSPGMLAFHATRLGDPRHNPVHTEEALFRGDIFYITCIDESPVMEQLYRKYEHTFHCVFERDYYSGNQWLEFMPSAASKSNAVRQLKDYLGCEKLVVFGDGKNDLDMFALADEAYAMAHAAPELKAIATGILGSNDDDAVARWLEQHG